MKKSLLTVIMLFFAWAISAAAICAPIWNMAFDGGIPGGAETRYLYDTCNRLFAEQDGKMKNDGVWLIHHYDRLSRPAFSAYAEVSNAVIENLCTEAFTVTAPAAGSVLASNTGGYVCPDELALKVSYSALAEAHYYDSYDCLSGLPEKWKDLATRSPMPGLETATAAGTHIRVKAYDNLGRVIGETYGDMTQNPEMESHFLYDYQGNITGQADMVFRSGGIIMRDITNTFYRSGDLYSSKIHQDGNSAIISRGYDGTGKVKSLNFGDNISRTFTYNVNGWQTSASTTAFYNPTMQLWPSDSLSIIKKGSANPPAVGIGKTNRTVIEEILHYADEADGVTPRYDGKIAARSCGPLLTAYGYDAHGRLASSQTVQQQHLLSPPDYSTAYSYDRNANITSLSRQGIVDRTILGNNVFGLHSRYTMKYAVNRLSSMEIEREGEDYEGRTGVSATGKISDFWYDANGNLGKDMSRGILSTNYNRLDLPTDVYFENGHRQTIEYDGFGQKRRVSYSQTSDPILGTMMGVPEDSAYTLTGRRDYIGPHVFVGDSLEYSAFPGGYFTPEGVFYYITDWQGNNIAVFSDKGELVQQTTYYPYGEPTIEPTGQRYLFGGKEREHAGGRNSYDFVARNLGPSANWDSADRKSESFYPFSPFSYCGGDPINFIDPTGMIPTPYESALMAGASYHDKNYDDYIDKLKEMNWVVSDFGTKICMNHPAGTGIGIQSMLFEKKGDNVEYAYVYAGTNSWEDAIEDLTQLVGISLEYDRAIENANILHTELGDSELTFIGHSMGGGNAAAASMATGRNAITFNPAAVSLFTKLFYGLGSSDNITNYRTVPEGVGLGGCFVNNLQDNLGMRASGQTIPIKIKSHNPFYAHKIEACIKYINKQ